MSADSKSAPKSKNPLKFVRRHKTAIACTITASAAVYVTRKIYKIDSEHVLSMLDATGRECESLSIQNGYFREFLDLKGLTPEISTFIKSLNDF